MDGTTNKDECFYLGLLNCWQVPGCTCANQQHVNCYSSWQPQSRERTLPSLVTEGTSENGVYLNIATW